MVNNIKKSLKDLYMYNSDAFTKEIKEEELINFISYLTGRLHISNYKLKKYIDEYLYHYPQDKVK